MNAVMRSPKIIQSMTKTEQKNNDTGKSTETNPSKAISLDMSDKMKIMQVKHKYEKMYNDYIGQTSSLTG
jgi:hypothetical protein